MEALIPFAAGYELIRQDKKDLQLIGPISDVLFDILIGAGCVSGVEAAWVGNVQMGSAYAFRKATESAEIEVRDHTNFTICLGLLAAGLGVPYLPARTALGSDLPPNNDGLVPYDCPVTGDRLLAVKAIKPDVAILAGQRADAEGNFQMWGNRGVTREAAEAAETIIVLVEEIVDTKVIRSDPNRTLIPGFRVDAVVEAPFGCHPSPVQGYWQRDHDFYAEYHKATKSAEGFAAWLDTYVHGAPDIPAFIEALGVSRVEALRRKSEALAAPVDYGA